MWAITLSGEDVEYEDRRLSCLYVNCDLRLLLPATGDDM